MHAVGLDIHRNFGEAAEIRDGVARQLGRFDLVRAKVVAFAKRLGDGAEVVIEATGNTMAVARLIAPHVKRVLIANPLQVRAIAHAKVKTDKIDALTLAKLHAAGFLPEVWQPDEATERLRRQVARRANVVQARTRLKNRVHAVLSRNLVRLPRGDLFSGPGRVWLASQPLELDEHQAVNSWLEELDRLGVELERIDQVLAKAALGDERVRLLMTVTGINLIVAIGVIAAIGNVSRFRTPEKLVSYFGLDPRVRQSGEGYARHGRISKIGRAHARALLVEAAWVAAVTPGPLRSFFTRIMRKRGKPIAAVATARKMAVIIWHLLTKNEDYAFARPALLEAKIRQMEIKAGLPSKRGGNKPGRARDYNIKALREKERALVAQAEAAYTRFVAAWSERPKENPRRAGAAKEERRS